MTADEAEAEIKPTTQTIQAIQVYSFREGMEVCPYSPRKVEYLRGRGNELLKAPDYCLFCTSCWNRLK
jgi:hypothetical protein